MHIRIRLIFLAAGLFVFAGTACAQAPPCPGYNPKNNSNLACEVPTAVINSTSQQNQSLSQLSPTLAAQLSQLPNATAVSGTGLTYGRYGFATGSTESLGTILTQRGDTLGYHKFYFSFTYQRFGFSSIDGVSLKHLNTVNEFDVPCNSGGQTVTCKDFVQARNRIDLTVDQFAAVGSFGLTDRIDVSLLVPFAKVTLKTGSSGAEFDVNAAQTVTQSHPLNDVFLAGSATGIGDVSVNLKANVVKGEHTKVALGGEVRFPTGDETNYLGTGAYGFKPYIVVSHTKGKITPNINLGYQWNGSSALFVNSAGTQLNLPSSFLYSGGLDYRAVKRLTLTAEFLGQAVIDGPRLASTTKSIPNTAGAFSTVSTLSSTYTMDSIGVGFKANPFKGLLITGNTLFKLDDGGLRSKIVPLVGVSYRF